VHLSLLYLTALTAFASAFWIMAANGFLQHPVGYRIDGNVLRLDDFSALLSNPTFTSALMHVIFASITAGGVFMTGVSAYHFIRRTPEVDFFRRDPGRGSLSKDRLGDVFDRILHDFLDERDVLIFT
jgi:cytochrome d ubiquinol oxidase subunit I